MNRGALFGQGNISPGSVLRVETMKTMNRGFSQKSKSAKAREDPRFNSSSPDQDAQVSLQDGNCSLDEAALNCRSFRCSDFKRASSGTPFRILRVSSSEMSSSFRKARRFLHWPDRAPCISCNPSKRDACFREYSWEIPRDFRYRASGIYRYWC